MPRTHAPGAQWAASSGSTSASSVPLRSASTSRSRPSRSSRERTTSTWSSSCPCRTSTAETLSRAPDGLQTNLRLMPDRTALVTGGAGGLGRSVVDALLGAGWRVVVPLERSGDLEERDGLSTVVADLTDPDDVARAVRAATADEGAPLRAVVHLVGGFAAGQPVADTPLADFERLFALNLRPTYLVTQAALPRLVAAGGGAIVCVGSSAALHPFAGGAGYAASKAAVLAFARAVAEEGDPDGVRCNAIVPTQIDTPANRAAMPESEHYKLVPPERIAKVVAFLCGGDSAAISGAAVPV